MDFRGGEVRAMRAPVPRPVSGALDSDRSYFTPTASHRHLGLYCLGVGWQEGAAAPMRGRVLDSYAAVLVRHGSGALSSERSGSIALTGPVLFWLFPGVAHTYAPDEGGWSEQWLLFNGFSARSYEDLGFLQRDRPVVRLDPAGREIAIFAEMVQRCVRPGPRTDVEVAAMIHQLVVASGETADTEPGDRAEQVVAQLRAEACSTASIAEHARRLGVTVAGLRELVRRRTGSAPKELVLQARISQAKALLAHTEMLVAQVAHEIGYDDPAYFSRVFTRMVGTSPATFRAQQARRLPEPPR